MRLQQRTASPTVYLCPQSWTVGLQPAARGRSVSNNASELPLSLIQRVSGDRVATISVSDGQVVARLALTR